MPKPRVKRRQDGRYAMQIYLGRKDGKRTYKTVYGNSPKEVEERAVEVRLQLKKGIDVTAARDTFEVWANRWLKLKASEVSAGRLQVYQYDVKRLDCLYPIEIAKLKVGDLQEVIVDLAASGLSKKTLLGTKSTLRQIFDYAIENRILDYNPALAIKLPKSHESEGRRALTPEEQGWIVNTPHRAQTAAMLMMYAGLRRGEVIPLTWNDVDLTAKTIRVNKSVEVIGNKFAVKAGAKTEAGNRIVYIPQILADYLAALPRNSLLLCSSAKGDFLTPSGWRRMWESYLCDLNLKYGVEPLQGKRHKYAPQKAEVTIPHITPHWLRHTFATLLYLSGVDVLTAKEQLGHTDIKTTLEIYTHLDKTHKRKSGDKLDEYISGCKSNASQG